MDIPNHFQDDYKDQIPGEVIVEEEAGALDGFLGGIHLGYAYLFESNFTLGVEGYGNLTSREFQEAEDASQKWKNTMAYGGSLVSGYLVNGGNLIYGRVGAGMGQFEDPDDKAVTSTQMSFQYGLGFETTVTQRIALRGEYSFDRYENLTPADEHFTLGINFSFWF